MRTSVTRETLKSLLEAHLFLLAFISSGVLNVSLNFESALKLKNHLFQEWNKERTHQRLDPIIVLNIDTFLAQAV